MSSSGHHVAHTGDAIVSEMARMDIKDEFDDDDCVIINDGNGNGYSYGNGYGGDEDEECSIIDSISVSSTPPPTMDDFEVKVETPTFEDFGFLEELLSGIRAAKYLQPYATQSTAINAALNGLDILCETPSKSGKTAIFVLSTLHKVSLKRDEPKTLASPSVLVVVPTRELADQIFEEYKRLGSSFGTTIRVLRLIGGIHRGGDEELLTLRGRNLIDIVVGTPGRVKDLADRGLLKMNAVQCFICDEAHRTLGFEDMRADVQHLFLKTPLEKQTMLFACPMSSETRFICRQYLRDETYCLVMLQNSIRRAKTLLQHQHRVIHLTEDHKLSGLLALLTWLQNVFPPVTQIVIFTDTVERTSDLTRVLRIHRPNENIVELSSALFQNCRLKFFSLFSQNKSPILVASDLAARGLNFENVAVVVNFDVPQKTIDYEDRTRVLGRNVEKSLVISFARYFEEVQRLCTQEELKKYRVRKFDWIV